MKVITQIVQHLRDNHGEIQICKPGFLRADDVSKLLGISRASAYRIIRQLNEELASKGYLVFPGRVPEKYFAERMYCA